MSSEETLLETFEMELLTSVLQTHGPCTMTQLAHYMDRSPAVLESFVMDAVGDGLCNITKRKVSKVLGETIVSLCGKK